MSLPHERLIVALDVSTASEAARIIQSVGDSAGHFKVGKQLFTAVGPQIVRDLVASGKKVFLDLKFHDIPNTVAAAVRSASALGIDMLTVHASGGGKMLKAAVEAASSAAHSPLILAVTVLTSFTDQDLQEIGFSGKVTDNALRLASLAQAAGCRGVVSSVAEVKALRQMLGTGKTQNPETAFRAFQKIHSLSRKCKSRQRCRARGLSCASQCGWLCRIWDNRCSCWYP